MIVFAQDGFVYRDETGLVIQGFMPLDPYSMDQHKAVLVALESIQQQLVQRIARFDEDQAQAFARVLGLPPAPPEESDAPA